MFVTYEYVHLHTPHCIYVTLRSQSIRCLVRRIRNESCHIYEWVISNMWMRRIIHQMHKGWRRILVFVGHFPQKSPVISVSFAETNCNLEHPVGRRHSTGWILGRIRIFRSCPWELLVDLFSMYLSGTSIQHARLEWIWFVGSLKSGLLCRI